MTSATRLLDSINASISLRNSCGDYSVWIPEEPEDLEFLEDHDEQIPQEEEYIPETVPDSPQSFNEADSDAVTLASPAISLSESPIVIDVDMDLPDWY